MNRILKKAVEDAKYDREGSGLGVPTKKDLSTLITGADLLNKKGDIYDFVDAQHDLINALLVKLYG